MSENIKVPDYLKELYDESPSATILLIVTPLLTSCIPIVEWIHLAANELMTLTALLAAGKPVELKTQMWGGSWDDHSKIYSFDHLQ